MEDPVLKISVVVPVFNEAEVLMNFHQRLTMVLANLEMAYEVIYVNDGSTDRSMDLLLTLKAACPFVSILDLSRNFGKEIALSAGLDHSEGDAVVVIDADLQDPPELIPQLVEQWFSGFDVVYAKRTSRKGESWLKRFTAHAFYRCIRAISSIEIPKDTGDFRLLSRRAVDSLKKLREKHRFMKGLFAWIGFRQTAVLYERSPRAAGHTKWNYWQLWNFALEGITSFTIAPLKFASYLGFITAAGAFVYASIIIYKTLMYGEAVPGYPSLMVVILFLGGIQLLTLGIIGEYLGRMFNETKQRPLYLINQHFPAENTAEIGSGISESLATNNVISE